MRPVRHNLWAYHKQILDEEKAIYYQQLNLRCLGLDGDLFEFPDDTGDQE